MTGNRVYTRARWLTVYALHIASLLLLLLLAACQTRLEPEHVPQLTNTPTAEVVSAVATPTAPLPTATPTVQVPANMRPFAIEEPLIADMTQVEGEGPPGVSITLVDVTYMGEQIGGGIIGEDGTFSIEVSPLRETHRIGIMLDTELPSDLAMFKDKLWGEGGMSIPRIGDVYASAQIRSRE
jgi:hypothetical protein